MEEYLSPGATFKYRQSITLLQFCQELDGNSFASEKKTKLLEDFIKRRMDRFIIAFRAKSYRFVANLVF